MNEPKINSRPTLIMVVLAAVLVVTVWMLETQRTDHRTGDGSTAEGLSLIDPKDLQAERIGTIQIERA
ncbi:MAG: hypothetical protein R3236_08910, partial [Phycisphaeraceae bacterium]|nr:hypothetical protein [Phycisphaeraceae bacterium]